jgi:hypothetical protein
VLAEIRIEKKVYHIEFMVSLLTLQGSLADRSRECVPKARQNTQWAEHAFFRFIVFQQEKVNKGEISGTTIPNYNKNSKIVLWNEQI